VKKTIVACVAVALIAGTTTATAASLITSKDIKNGTIQASDIKKGTISASRLSSGLRKALGTAGHTGPAGKDGATVYGPKGDVGPQGPQGERGAPGRDGAGNDGAAGPKGDTGSVGPAGPAGATGPQGLKGDKGDKGDAGVTDLEADGPYPGETDLGNLPNQGDNSGDRWGAGEGRRTSWVQCAPGKTALGGGFHLAADAGDAAAKAVQVVVSEPAQIEGGELVYNPIAGDAAGSFKPNGWLVQGFNTGPGDVVVRPWVICAKVN
jgi:hypothetical protein